MLPFPTIFDDQLRTLAGSSLEEDGQSAVNELDAKGYKVKVGLTPSYSEKIFQVAQDQSIREYCPSDTKVRFLSREAAEKWLSKGRVTYLLIWHDGQNDEELAGYGWLGRKESSAISGSQTTFSLRVGEKHQGKGLAVPFSRAVISDGLSSYQAEKFWLEAWESNGGAVHVYHKLGFVDVDKKTEDRPTAGGETVKDVRIYMRLPDQQKAVE